MKMVMLMDQSSLMAILAEEYLHEEIPLDFDLQCHLIAVCEEYGVPQSVALGVIQAESSFTATASNGSCYGYNGGRGSEKGLWRRNLCPLRHAALQGWTGRESVSLAADPRPAEPILRIRVG